MDATANTASDTVIRVENLTVSKADLTICCLSGMAVVSGERLGIVGPNGSGKTTLLRVLAGLETEYTGQCRIAVDQRERIFLHQSPYLFRGTVLHNVAYGLVARSMPRAKRLDIVRECLERLGMSEFEDRDVSSLSGGERRRVALARACILRPQLLLLDEPLAELDSGGVESVQRSLAELSQSTILIASPTPLPSEFAERTVKFSKESK